MPGKRGKEARRNVFGKTADEILDSKWGKDFITGLTKNDSIARLNDIPQLRNIDPYVKKLLVGIKDEDVMREVVKSLMRGGGDEIGNRHGAVVNADRDEARVVGHVHEQPGPDLVRDRFEFVMRNLARVSTRTRDDQFRFVLASQRGDLIEVQPMRVRCDSIADEVVQDAGDIESHAVSQMAAVR